VCFGYADYMKIRTLLVAVGLALCFFVQASVAGQLEDGYEAFAREDYASAFKLLKPLADEGDVGAQTQVGMMYEHGLGIPQDYTQAVALFRLAADRGNFIGQYNLSAMYKKGTGVKQDYAEAAKWLKLAAEQGFGQAQFMLGRTYSLGKELRQDYRQAYMWYSLAASNKAFSDYLQIASKHERTKYAELKMTPDQISEAQQLTAEWIETHPKAVSNPVFFGK
jgi:TPR repeat protein